MTRPDHFAYPLPVNDRGDSPQPDVVCGLTKREAFAMAAMQGLLANQASWPVAGQILASCAVDLADALISALNTPGLNEQ